MTTHPERVQVLAAEANSYLRRDTIRDIILPVAAVPDWFTDLCREAHAGMWPDDWKYEFIHDALNALEDGADDDRIDLDTLYPYTADRLQWLASHLDRPGFCDAAAEEYGSSPVDILTFVAWGMDRELRDVFAVVRGMLDATADAEVNEAVSDG